MKRLIIQSVILLCAVLFWYPEIYGAETPAAEDSVFVQDTETKKILIDSLIVIGVEDSVRNSILPLLLSVKGNILNQGYIDHDIKAMESKLKEDGWWNAKVVSKADTVSDEKVVLTYEIMPGKPAIFGEIAEKTAGNPGFNIPVPGQSLYGKVFKVQEYKKVLDDIIEVFFSNGYPNPVISPEFTSAGDTISVKLDILPGTQAQIDSISITGIERTKPYVILRSLGEIKGMKAGPEALIAAKRALISEGIVGLAGEPEIFYTGDGKGVLVLNLNEEMQGSFDGALGYQPSDDGGGELVGRINFLFPNIAGTGRYGRFQWENAGKNTENLDVEYREPWILGTPYSVSGAFSQEQRGEQDYTKTTMQLNAGRKFGNIQTDLGIIYEKVSADSLNSSGAKGINAGIQWDNVDNPQNPSSGVEYAVRWAGMSKEYRFGLKENHNIERLELDLNHFLRVGNKKAAAIFLRYLNVDIPKDDTNQADKFWLGGSSSIRGYREKSFPAVQALWATVEYRFLGEKSSRTFLFLDSGYIMNYVGTASGKVVKDQKYLTGYGFGVRIDSRAGTLGFDYGLGKGDSISQGKLHVSLMNSF